MVTSFSESDKVLALRDVTFASMDLAQFTWQPCQQVESLDQECFKTIFEDGDIKGYGAAYQLDDTHFRLNLIVHPDHLRKGIGSQLLKRVEQAYYLSKNDRKSITWDVEPDSYSEIAADADKIAEHVLSKTRSGSIIILHVMYPNRRESLKAVKRIVPGIEGARLQF